MPTTDPSDRPPWDDVKAAVLRDEYLLVGGIGRFTCAGCGLDLDRTAHAYGTLRVRGRIVNVCTACVGAIHDAATA
jgi:hypothetical protein